MTSATSSITITKLRSIFATHGLPNMLVSDNGSVFTSEEILTSLRKRMAFNMSKPHLIIRHLMA